MKKVLIFILMLSTFLCVLTACNETVEVEHIEKVEHKEEIEHVVSKLELSHTQIELKVGESTYLTVKGEHDSEYTYTSSSSSVSVSNDGKVTAVNVGSSVITVTNGYTKGVCVVVVSDTSPIALEKLEISSDNATLSVGVTKQIEITKTPINADDYNSIRFSSDNEEVATITRSGVITTLKPGTVNITATATGTNKSVTIAITVVARENSLKFIHDDITALVNEDPLTLETDLFTDYSDVEVVGFTSSDSSVASVDNTGKVTFNAVGKAVISYSIKINGESLIAECKVAVIEKEGYTVIRTPEQLQAIGNISGNYMLGNDIDLAEACAKGGSLYYAGLGFSPLFNKKALAFSGTFDGMGYSIKNIYINRPETPFVALFGYINVNKGSEGVIQNLALEGGKIEGGNHVSVFASYHNGSGSANAGVKNCWTNVEIVAHGNHSGGLISYNGGMIENCYSLSKMTGSGYLSSVSHNTAESNEIGVKNTYVASDVNSMATALVYEKNLRESVMLAQYKTTEELKSASLYAGWDTNIWLIEDGKLPTLKTANDR